MTGAGGEFYYVTDGNGSTVALVDTTGTVQATYNYDPAGQTTNVGGPNPAIAGGNPYRYAGGYTDTTTGLIKYGARYYNPTLGRWTQLDALTSLLDFTNGNRYAYAGDDPINNSDPSGHCIFGHVDGPDSACRGSNVDHDLDNVSKGAGVAATVADASEIGAPVGLALGAVGVAASGAKTAHECFGDASEDTCKGDVGSLTVGAATLGTGGAATAFKADGTALASDVGNNLNDAAGSAGVYDGG